MNSLISFDALIIRAIQRDGFGITPGDGQKFRDCYAEGPGGELLFNYTTPTGAKKVVSALDLLELS